LIVAGATAFSSDDDFVSQYGFRDRGEESQEGVSGEGNGDMLVSEYSVSPDMGAPDSEGAVEDMEDSFVEEPRLSTTTGSCF
jgi:hypothetical protein